MKTHADKSRPTSARRRVCAALKILPLLIAGCFDFGAALANPVGPQVISGQVSMTTQDKLLTITNSPNAVINWQSFSLNPGDITRFIQQSSSSAVLNRIVGQDPSQILGALQSNGRVFLINPNGILFGRGAQVDVNGLVASTLNLGNDDFLAGKYNFKAGDKAGAVSNQGAITTPNGGQVYLIAPHVENSGIITSPKGDVLLAAGRSVQLVDSVSPDLRVVVSAPDDQALNLGQVIAQGGKIGIYGALVNQRGIVNANSAVVGESGKIIFKASRDTILDNGSQTSANGAGKGGEIQILGDRVGLIGDARVDASGQSGGGTVLIGGDYQGANAGIQNARRTYVGKDATIKADALHDGDGGKVIVWSDEATRAYGSISARGGQQGGNGGFVETSGHYLDVAGIRINAGAPGGKGGTWLLDPYDIEVLTTANGGSITLADFDQFADLPATGVSKVSADTISASGSNVILQATHNLTFTDPVGITAAGVTLTALAGNNITVNGGITTNNGVITLSANDAGGPASGTGMLTVNGTISSNGAAINLSGETVNFWSGPVASSDGNINVTSGGNMAADGGNIDAAGGGVTLVAGGSIDVSSGTSISANSLKMTAANGITDGAGGAVATQVNSLNVRNTGIGDIMVSNSGGNLSIADIGSAGYGVKQDTAGQNIAIYSTANINVGAAINASAGNVLLNAGTAIVEGGGVVTGASLNAVATSGIGSTGAPLLTKVGALSATNNGANSNIVISNTGPLHIQGLMQAAVSTGSITIDNYGALTVDPDFLVRTDAGAITLTAHSPLTVDGIILSNTGNITLEAGSTGSSGDILSVSSTGSVSTTGAILLRAGAAINIYSANSVTGGSVTQQANLNTPPPPTLSQCVADPTLSGCTAVLPTLAQCTADPTLAGCTAVLPTLAQCTTTPTLAGCTAVLPTLAQCTTSPTLAGCTAVLPTLAQCTTTPTLAGCTAVLPTLASCTATPTLAGCTAVLPSITQCSTDPTLAGCTAVLPTLAACIANPATAGCIAVLPTLSACIANPATAGCTVVLPTLTACIANPATAGCTVVLPTLTACIANPATAGCVVVLPTLAACIANPATAGCGVVLPSLSQCVLTPNAAGCNVVLPTLAQCTTNPTLAGCSVVLPTISQCAAAPTIPGCEVVLPTTHTASNEPVNQAINTNVKLVNTSTATGSDLTATGKNTNTGKDIKTSDSNKDDKKDNAATDKPGMKNDDAAKKMYCN